MRNPILLGWRGISWGDIRKYIKSISQGIIFINMLMFEDKNVIDVMVSDYFNGSFSLVDVPKYIKEFAIIETPEYHRECVEYFNRGVMGLTTEKVHNFIS